MSRLIRTTITPSEEIVVSDGEYLQLLQWGLVYGETSSPAPPDPDDVEVAGFLDNETSQTYARLLAQLATAVQAGTGVLPEALRAASVAAVVASSDVVAGSLSALRRPGPGGALLAVTNNARGVANDAASSGTAGTSRCPHVVGADASDIRFVYANAYQTHAQPSVDKDGTATLTVRASVEIGGTGGNIYRLTFGGQTTGTVDPGGVLISDPLPVELAKGSIIYSRTYVSGTAWWNNARGAAFAGVGGWVATTDLTTPGAYRGDIPQNRNDMYVPSAIIGTTRDATAQSWLIVGDSIAHGTGDNNGSILFSVSSVAAQDALVAGGGYIARALSGQAGMVNIAVDGDVASGFGPLANHFRRVGFARYCTHALLAAGRNDLSNGATMAQLQSSLLTNARLLTQRGLRVSTVTITPRTTSTDFWSSVAGQTPSPTGPEPIRTSYNDWLRAGAPIDAVAGTALAAGAAGALLVGQAGHPVSHVFDAADAAESSRNSGRWKPGRAIAGVTTTAGGAVITTSSPSFTSADVGAPMIIPGAGAAGAVTGTLTIGSVDSSTQVTLYGSAATTAVTGGTAYVGMLTADGTHPHGYGATALAAAINLSLV